jgi:asparagine synthase (glutamine-hydrolysing)
MCGIAGYVSLNGSSVDGAMQRLNAMSQLIAHRGPDGHGFWTSKGTSE